MNSKSKWIYIGLIFVVILVIVFLLIYFVFPFYNEWGEWTSCSRKCGSDTDHRLRTCKFGRCKLLREDRNCTLPTCTGTKLDFYYETPGYTLDVSDAKLYGLSLENCADKAYAGDGVNKWPYESFTFIPSDIREPTNRTVCHLSKDTKITKPLNYTYHPSGAMECTYYQYTHIE